MTVSATKVLPRRHDAVLTVAVFLAALLLYARPLALPVLAQDDFQILSQSWTWQKTVDGLWTPNNEHAMPLGRLLTFAVVQLAGRPTALPFFGVLTGIVGVWIGMALTCVFVRRELGHPFYGLTAMILFGVTTVYQQAVYWFAASFSVYALDTFLLALLAAQRYRQSGRGRWLILCGLGCVLAPGWFASGVLAGPLCCLYLLPREDVGQTRPKQPWHALFALVPLIGTAAFLAVSLPLTAGAIQHLEHYRAQNVTAVEAFRPLTGAWYTVRSVVDNLFPGLFGISGITFGPVAAAPLFLGMVAAGFWWARRSPRRHLALLGAGLIFGSYLLIYSGRAMWRYDDVGMFTPSWSRYHLQPQLGLVLLICGGLPAWQGRWFRLDESGRLTAPQLRGLACLLGVCLLVQAPRGLFAYYPPNPQQAATLRRIERISDFCNTHHISAEAARRALGVLKMPESNTIVDGWEFLRGSDDPKEWSPEEVREMLKTAD
jgi:MFS family permease